MKNKPDNQHKKTLALIGLIVNIMFLPGVGTIIGGNILIGIIQTILYLGILIVDIYFLLSLNIRAIMILLVPGLLIWIWAIVTSVLILRRIK